MCPQRRGAVIGGAGTKRGERAATIADVARRAGVSIKTVSRVTNNEPNVRDETRAKVMRAVAELGYQPNLSARSLASRRTFLVGLLYDNPSASYLVGVQNGALKASRAAGYDLIIHPCDYTEEGLEREIDAILRQAKVDGFVLTPPLSDRESLVAMLERRGTAFSLVAPATQDYSERAIYTNDAEICAELTRYLHSLGHERIGFVVGHPDHGAVLKRYDGYRRGLADSGLELDETIVAQGYNSFESGLACARELLARDPTPTAIFASNDDMAAGVLRAAQEAGLHIPEDLSIAGFDDIPLARQLWPALTTVRQPIAAMAEAATMLVLEQLGQLREQDPIDTIIPSQIMVRESTGPAPR